MPQIVEPRYALTVHPLHAVFVGGALSLFVGAAVSDVAYAMSFDIQWNNFASWLLVGALICGGAALIFAIVDLFRAQQRARGVIPYSLVWIAAWVVGFFNALIHARDAWASMPAGLILSLITVVLACIATWLGFRTPHIFRTPRVRGAV